ncbi:MAG TPA: nuclear transport factor 2 family protein, partial [Polyangiaceae bacterium]|nr:nuclear transport factor 2 family protein [Polyangiaceae bacterium]
MIETRDAEHPNLQLVRSYLRALEDRGDEARLRDFFRPDVRQRELPNRLVERGAERDLEALLAGSRKGRQVVQNERYVVRNALVDGDRVAVEVSWSAELKVPLGALPVGATLSAESAMFFRIVE